MHSHKMQRQERYRIIQIYANELWLETCLSRSVTEREMRLTSALIKCTDYADLLNLIYIACYIFCPI